MAYSILKEDRIVESEVPGNLAGITTTRIFGRLCCPAGKRAKRENRVFFLTWEDAIAAGYRPCKVCKPESEDR